MNASHLRLALALAVFPAAIVSQSSRNVELLAAWRSPTNPSYAAYSDVWGYYDPVDGREIAIIGSYEGLHFVDCTDPRNPRELKSFVTPVPNTSGNRWRDIKVFGHHVYEVSEAYGGTRIFGIAQEIPVLKAWWGRGNWGNAHNIAMDRGTGIAYVPGTNRGMVMFDCSGDPANPTYLGRLSSPYFHDVAIADGYAYCCEQNGNRLRIYDVSNAPNLTLLSQIGQPGSGIAHNCWPSRDGTLCVTTNETNGSPMGIFDVSNKNSPALLSTYRVAPAASNLPHNAFLRDRIAHASWYDEGYRSVDLSDPSNPVEVGFYDARNGSAGAWGCYHEQPSGVIYISDIGDGLLILKPKSSSRLFGAATPGTGGAAPEMHTRGAAFTGNANFGFEVEGARPGAQALLLLSPNQQTVAFQGLTLHVDLGPGLLTAPLTIDGAGRAVLSRPIAGTAMSGKLFVQVLVVDPASGSTLGLSASRGMEIEVFAP